MSPPASAPIADPTEDVRPAADGPDAAASRGLVEAKLLVPRTRPGTVRRTRALHRLRSARNARVVAVLAPPGYGKTSALAQWVAGDPRSVAWVTADEGDNDPVVLLTYLAAALDRLEPLDPDVFGAIASPAVSDRAAAGRLLAAMSGRATPTLIVIDDAHRITDRGCLDVLAEFIAHLPEASAVVIASREPVGLPFARWRVDGSLLELGPGELAMDQQEMVALVRHLGLILSAGAMDKLTRRTEGWPALVALAARAAQRQVGPDVFPWLSHDLFIADYLRSELLETRSEADIVFLTRTSILERLSGPVCDLVADRRGSSDLLAKLARSTLLVDEYGGSYRYHSLLREFLRDELEAREPERVAELHRRAAAWYAVNGAVDLGVEHAFGAGDPDLSAAVVGRAMLGYHWSGRRATTRAWFKRFSDESLEERPWLAVLAAWEELAAGDVAATEHFAAIAELGSYDGRPPDGTDSFESGRAMLRAAMSRSGPDDMLASATSAVELEPPNSPWRDFALWMLAFACLVRGDREGADAALVDAIASARANDNMGLCHCLIGHRALLAIDRQDWTAAVGFAAESRSIGKPAYVDGYLSSAPALVAEVRIAIHRGDIPGARRHLAHATSLRPLLTAAHPAAAVICLVGFARAHLAVGDPAGARTLLTQASEVIRLRPDLGVLPDEVAALRAAIVSRPLGLTNGASTLTVAEFRVLALLPYYLSFKEIGQRLGVKATTVKTHALAIYGKLGASTRGEAVDLAVAAGLLEQFPT